VKASDLPPGYFDACDRLAVIVREVVRTHGRPSFLLPPLHVWVPAPLDAVGNALALNDAARELVRRAEGADCTLMMLDAILQVDRIPGQRLALRPFCDVISKCGLLLGLATTREGETLLRDALSPAKEPKS
jgi:hypothetical protein